jgi:hypothetical protein
MIRTAATYIIAVLLLLVNIQAAMSDAGEIFHQDSDIEIVLATDTAAHMNDAGEDTHCQHCCHTHASYILAYESLNHHFFSFETYFYHLIGKSGPTWGPPTPPPNA